jgi:3-hydroxymyristoyl/3-hydroxydecanoyl-(acyl carrier protein) dehydratase
MSEHRMPLRLSVEHPSFAGHFPGNPIVPGVVLLDEALHAIEQAQPAVTDTRPWQIGTVKFHHIVRPGEAVELSYRSQPDGAVHFELRSGGALVASGTAMQRTRMRTVIPAR